MPVNHRYRSWQRNPARGFTLLELAVVMVIIGLLLAIWSYTVPWIDEEGARERTRAIMEEAHQSLLAFARTNHRLPCPDTNNDGFEGGVGGCQAADVTGTLPHETLLLSAPVQDAHHVPVAYTLYRNPVAGADLGRLVNRIDTMDDVDGANNVTGTLNVCDFCEALRNGNPTAGSGFASTSIQNTTGGCGGGVLLNQAYVLASSGFEDRDGNSLLFDGDNATAPLTCFASPARGRSSEYDDIVVAMSFDLLIGELCRSPVCLGPNPVFP